MCSVVSFAAGSRQKRQTRFEFRTVLQCYLDRISVSRPFLILYRATGRVSDALKWSVEPSGNREHIARRAGDVGVIAGLDERFPPDWPDDWIVHDCEKHFLL